MPFNLTSNVEARTHHSTGVVYHLEHFQEPYSLDNQVVEGPRNVQNLASQYLSDVAHIYNIPSEFIQDLNAPLSSAPTEESTTLRFAGERTPANTTTVSYVQTVLGLPIWEAGVTLSMMSDPLRVVSSTSSVHSDVQVTPAAEDAPYKENITETQLAKLLGVEGQSQEPVINSSRLLVYQYNPKNRLAVEEPHDDSATLEEIHPTLPIPDVPAEITADTHYVVREVLFTYPDPNLGNIPWRVFIEVNTGAVLYLRAGVCSASGYVFVRDPKTQSATGPAPTGTTAQLDPFRELRSFNVAQQTPRVLAGEFVKVSEISPPAAIAPVSTTDSFLYSVTTDNFSAVNAYYQMDKLFRMIDELGYNVYFIFDGTSRNPGFPVPVDFRGLNDIVNAQGIGNTTMDGSGGFIFGRAASGTSVGIADDPRVAAHEFCHALLWDSVHSPNFGFGHSAGDSIAAVLNDPGSAASDRFLTFPWIGINRRHDRAVNSGWAWGGSNDVGGYNSEQILSTTLFRLYRSLGGDAKTSSVNYPIWASRYVVYLIVGAIASLGKSSITPTPTPDIFASAMMNADSVTLGFDREPGGEVRKVIRWAFEKQGLYQPAGAPKPVTTPGAPPAVDVYIDDGRHGEYQYQEVFWENQDIWNRYAADGGLTNQSPKAGVKNYAYVRIKNRGTQAASNVVVNAYTYRQNIGSIWPSGWKPMETPKVTYPSQIPSGGSAVVGPFAWTPAKVTVESIMMAVSATGDRSNIDPASYLPCASGPIPTYRLIPFDNNIGLRNLAVIQALTGAELQKSLHGAQFTLENPYDRSVVATITVTIPKFLKDRNWDVGLGLAGNNTVALGPYGSKEITITISPGEDFKSSDIEDQPIIRFSASIDGITVGGMSYLIDSNSLQPESPKPPIAGKEEAARSLLDAMNLPLGRVRKVHATRVTLDIDLEETD